MDGVSSVSSSLMENICMHLICSTFYMLNISVLSQAWIFHIDIVQIFT